MKKQPKQKRSQAMVEAILEASTRVLSKSPLSEMTTNNVADIAGVSIGSLYDYFPNKNSIVVALMDNRMQKQLNEFFALLEKQNTLDELIDLVVELIDRDYMTKKAFLREVFLLAPESGRMEALFLNRVKAQKALEKFMIEKMGRDHLWAEKKSFVVINAVLGVIETYIVIDELQTTKDELRGELAVVMRAVLEVPQK